jgi:hypothetical protein
MSFHGQRFDARFWGPVLFAFILTAAFGCFGLAAAAQSATAEAGGIISVSESLRQMEQRNKMREAILGERMRAAAERARTEAVATDGVQ